MYCRECGKPLLDSDRFCSYCGTPVVAPEASADPMFKSEDKASSDLVGLEEEPETEFVVKGLGESVQWNTDIFPTKKRNTTKDVDFDWNISDDEFRNRPFMGRDQQSVGERPEPSFWAGTEAPAAEKATGLSAKDTGSWDSAFAASETASATEERSARPVDDTFTRDNVERYWEGAFKRDTLSQERMDSRRMVSISRDDIDRGKEAESVTLTDHNKLVDTMTFSKDEVEEAIREETHQPTEGDDFFDSFVPGLAKAGTATSNRFGAERPERVEADADAEAAAPPIEETPAAPVEPKNTPTVTMGLPEEEEDIPVDSTRNTGRVSLWKSLFGRGGEDVVEDELFAVGESSADSHDVDWQRQESKPSPAEEHVAPEEGRPLTGEELEKELFEDMADRRLSEAERLRKRQTEKIDKFYTFNKKNEEFQKLLDQEYEKFKKSQEPEDLAADLHKLGDDSFFEDFTNEGASQAIEMAKARQTMFHEDLPAQIAEAQAAREEQAAKAPERDAVPERGHTAADLDREQLTRELEAAAGIVDPEDAPDPTKAAVIADSEEIAAEEELTLEGGRSRSRRQEASRPSFFERLFGRSKRQEEEDEDDDFFAPIPETEDDTFDEPESAPAEESEEEPPVEEPEETGEAPGEETEDIEAETEAEATEVLDEETEESEPEIEDGETEEPEPTTEDIEEAEPVNNTESESADETEAEPETDEPESAPAEESEEEPSVEEPEETGEAPGEETEDIEAETEAEATEDFNEETEESAPEVEDGENEEPAPTTEAIEDIEEVELADAMGDELADAETEEPEPEMEDAAESESADETEAEPETDETEPVPVEESEEEPPIEEPEDALAAEDSIPSDDEKPTRVYNKGDIPLPTTAAERAKSFEEERAEAWDAFFSDDEDLNAGNTFDAEEEEHFRSRRRRNKKEKKAQKQKAKEEQRVESAASQDAQTADAPTDPAQEKVSAQETEQEPALSSSSEAPAVDEPSAKKQGGSLLTSTLAVILILLLVLIVVRLLMPDSILSIKMDEFVQRLLGAAEHGVTASITEALRFLL